MTNTAEQVLTTKDYFEIGYWVVTLFILCITAYAVYFAPLKAVEIGRKLNDEQNQLKVKSDLFLTLFSLRGNPTHYSFVNGLNQIDIVYQDVPTVLSAWKKLHDSLNNPNQSNALQNWDLLRVELLSEMAQSLGYQKLKQTEIQRSYSPQAHADQDDENRNYQQVAKKFFETGTNLYSMHIESIQASRNGNSNKILGSQD